MDANTGEINVLKKVTLRDIIASDSNLLSEFQNDPIKETTRGILNQIP